MPAAVEQYLPLAAWVALLLATSLVTWTVYKFTARASRDAAQLQGQIGTLAITFGGPVALFVALAWIGKSFIPSETMVRLEGEVTDVNGKPVPGVVIASTARGGHTDAQGKFSIVVPRSGNSQLDDLLAVSAWDVSVVKGAMLTDPSNVRIPDYPDPSTTVLVARDLADRDGRLVEDVRVFVEPVARPQGRQYQPGGEVTINIERRKYSVVLKDESGRELSREQFEIPPGQRFTLPSDITVNGARQ